MSRCLTIAVMTIGLWASSAVVACAEGEAGAPFADEFDGKQLDEAVWIKGGSAGALHTVREGSLRLVSLGMSEQANAATKRDDLNFFKKPLAVVWDLVSDKTLAGPYGATSFSKVYAGLVLGDTAVKKGVKGGAELGLTGWPGEAPPNTMEAPWFYTLNLGRLMPSDPTKNYGPEWVDNWRISGVPQRIVWTLDAADWSVEIKGAKFISGEPQKRAGKHALKAEDFAQSGFHLLIFSGGHVNSVESGANHISGVVYTDRIAVTSPDAVPPFTEQAPRSAVTLQGVLDQLLGKGFPEKTQASKPQYLFGVNYVGSEFRDREGGFLVPPAESLDYYKAKGVLLMRLPVTWQRLQPKLGEPVDEKQLDGVIRTVRAMGERNMKVLLDMHDYARHGKNLVGSEAVPFSAFTDLWKKLAETFKDEPAIWGYGLSNEPFNTKGTWPKIAQAGIDGVRAVDRKTMIVVGGDSFSGTPNWAKNGAELPKQLNDPSSNLCWEGHCYFDHGGSGKYNNGYEYEINRPDAVIDDPMIGVKRIEPFVTWLKANNYKGILGEFSVPANVDRDPRWLIILDNVYEYLRTNEIPSTYWAAGALWTPRRCYVLEPDWRNEPRGKERPQMRILLKHATKYAGAAPEQ